MNQFSLNNKHIIITGASSGIGKECAIMCSNAGAKITLIARDSERLNITLSEMQGGNHEIISHDLLQTQHIESIIDNAVLKLGRIDGFIHAAGIEGTVPINTLTPDEFANYFMINVISGIELAKCIAKKKNHSGNSCSLVFIASVMGVLGQSGKVAYCSSKGALINGVKALALELSTKKIRANCISPSIIKTPLTEKLLNELPQKSIDDILQAHPLGLGNAEDVANAAIFLLSDAAKWITGTNLIVDGGYTAK